MVMMGKRTSAMGWVKIDVDTGLDSHSSYELAIK